MSEDDAPGSGYALGRSVHASMRLNYQHWIWQKTWGYSLHPDIQIRERAAIADIGCGTGIWLLETSQELTSKHPVLTGFDNNLGQVPGGGAFFPQNISFEELDIIQTLRPRLENKFDVVNLRLFGYVLGAGGSRFDIVLSNLVKMLKPGGWLQWSEYDRTQRKFLKAYDHSTTAALEESFGGDMGDERAKIGDWTPRLAEHFSAAGLVETTFDQRWTPTHLLGMQQINYLAAHIELISGLEEGSEYKAKEQANQERLVKDVDSGGMYDTLMVVATGRKPFV